MDSENHKVYSMRVSDKFGNNGITGIAIIRQASGLWEIDTFLLSCKIIGRTVKQSLLSRIHRDATNEGVKKLIGHYIPTQKNIIVKDFYHQNGFKRSGEKWILNPPLQQIDIPEWINVV